MIKIIWMTLAGSALAVMLATRIIMAIRHFTMTDSYQRPVHRRV